MAETARQDASASQRKEPEAGREFQEQEEPRGHQDLLAARECLDIKE